MTRLLGRRTGLVALAATLAPALASAQASDPDSYGWGPQMMWWGAGWQGMFFGPLFMIVVLALLIAAVTLVVRWLGGPWQHSGPSHPVPPGRTPLDILKERFARGEIDKNEFDERRRVLAE